MLLPGGRNDSRGLLRSACPPPWHTPSRSVTCYGTEGHDGIVRSRLKRWRGGDSPESPSRLSGDMLRNQSRTSPDACRYSHGMSHIGVPPRLVLVDLPSIHLWVPAILLSSWKGAGQSTDRRRISHLPACRVPSLPERHGPFGPGEHLLPNARDDNPCIQGRTHGKPARAR